MLEDNTHNLSNRRTFLKTTSSLAITSAFAGCSGSSDGDDSEGVNGDEKTTSRPADNYPSKDISFIVPYSTGGGYDAYARLMKPYLEEELNTTVNIKNVTGGGGVVGVSQAYNAEPDGHTITIWDPLDGGFPQVGQEVGYDLTEMTHIGYVTQAPNALTIMKSADMDNWEAFTDNVSELNFATQGQGTVAHMNTVFLASLTGAFNRDNLNFVHYDGTGQALGGLEKGESDAFMVGASTSAVKVVQALDAEMFTVFADKDHTISEYISANDVAVEHWSENLDVENIKKYNDIMVFRRFLTGPPGVPNAIQQKQVEAFETVINNDEFRQKARESARPLINPEAKPERVSEIISDTLNILQSDPYKGIIEDALST